MRAVLAAPVALLMLVLLLAGAGCTGSAMQNDVNQLKERVGKLEQELAALPAN
ncbi:MAG: hypothetical protein QME70_04150 [Bacillota bacterium]|nr:hypothetical protein [Bacillota bacterium]